MYNGINSVQLFLYQITSSSHGKRLSVGYKREAASKNYKSFNEAKNSDANKKSDGFEPKQRERCIAPISKQRDCEMLKSRRKNGASLRAHCERKTNS